MDRISTFSAILFVSVASLSSLARAQNERHVEPLAAQRPNVLWISIEDWSPDLSCYGTKGLHTPYVDQLADEGIRYERAFTTSPVCSTSRSAMMTGFHQNYIRANQHRENDKQPLPQGIKPIPHLMRDAGYFTALMSRKTDCNFVPNTKEELFEGTDWNQRKPGQPFFARITFGGTHRSWKRDPQRPINIKDVELPPYYADTPFVRRDWANGLEQMQLVDREVGALLQRLSDEGLADNTIVFFIGDHGRCHIRGKQFLYDGGIRIPMIMRWPGKVPAGQVSSDLVMSIDICATVLDAAGAKPLVPLHGQNLLSHDVKKRQYVFAARDKMDETHDAMRAIRSKDHKLILNLMPERPWCQFNRYKEGAYPVLAEMNILNLQGKLNPEQAAFFAASKPELELFDLKNDPHEVNNVADDPAYANIKSTLLRKLQDWRANVIDDLGITDEFRANDVFPVTNPVDAVNDWVELNQTKFDFNRHGWPAWYPTRTLEDWQTARAAWESYVFRGPNDSVARPFVVFPKKTSVLIKDDFSVVETESRILSAGHWAIVGGEATARHETEPGQQVKKHGPKASFTSSFSNGSLVVEFKPTSADAVVLTIDSAPATHVFRVRANVEGGAKDIQDSLIATFAEKEEGAKKAKSIMLVTEGIPSVKPGQWNRIEVKFLGNKAIVVVNDETFTVRHDRIAQAKLTSKLELQKGAIALRKFHLSGF